MVPSSRYQIIRELPKGGMGVVNLAYDNLLKREVVIKTVLRPAAEGLQNWRETVQRLIREAQSAAGLRHENIVTIYDVVVDGDVPSIVMEFVRGGTLSDAIEPGHAADPSFAMRVLRECAAALDHAHSRGIVHRDVKPSNIMLDEAGSVRLADFGIAKMISAGTDLTHGMVIGTLEYMSPEQLEARHIDSRTDQYSLAVVAYWMLTGHKIFDADSMGAWCHMVVSQMPQSASLRNPALPAAVDTVLARGMAKAAAARYDSCASLVAGLESAIGQPRPVGGQNVAAAPPGAGTSVASRETLRRALPRWAVAVGGLLLLIVAIRLGMIYLSNRGTEKTIRRQPPVAGLSSLSASNVARSMPPDALRTGHMWKNQFAGGTEYVSIASPGEFTMGCVAGDHSCDPDEEPHNVRLDRGYWIGKTEVEVRAYKQFAQATGTTMPPAPEFNPGWSHEDHPIVQITWAEAKAYCEWVGGRLPTEAEWEYAARGGQPGEKYVSGVRISPADANYNGSDSFEFTAPVGSFPSNRFGLKDVSGNAAEWVDGGNAELKVVRGGSWNVYPDSLRLSKRVLANPERRNFTFGTRCAM
jgi:serine/threonine protein kinase/formylglycine-generating enzyme required for sulfatase activity